MPPNHRYNLRKRQPGLKWLEDEALKEEEESSDEEDSDYEPSVASSEEESEVEEEVETESEDEPPSNIIIPMPKKGVRVSIEIVNGREDEDDFYEDDEDDEDMLEIVPAGRGGGFLDYLAAKYGGGKKKSKKEGADSPPIELNHEEQEYFDDQTKAKQKKLTGLMKKVSGLVSKGDVPYKFRVLDLPVADSVKAKVLQKIEVLNETHGDHKLQQWIDGFFQIPFGKHIDLPVTVSSGPEKCKAFLREARTTMDKAVYGMLPAKTQMMQILAQWISNPSSIGNVIALKGSPGVGKTSFAKHGVAEVLHRPFVFFGLGGATDASHFLGHSYTYEGSTWGRIVDAIMMSRCSNPVLYFDELDKISTTPQGEEIASMLIHMTDRTQNSQFHDRYFAGIDIDLSQCLFVFSLNDESKVHPILKDRMQLIHCSGYSAEEKKSILTQYALPQLLERLGMVGQITFSDVALKFMIEEYSHEEEGVRTLMRAAETLIARINLLRLADEEVGKTYKFYRKIELPLTVDADTCRHILQDIGAPKGDESYKRMYV